MIRINKLQVIRLSLLLLGVVVLLLTLTAMLSTQVQAGGEVQNAPAKVEAQPANIVNPRPKAAAVAFDLCASDGSITLADSTSVDVWGFVETGSCTTGLVNSLPGPELRVVAGDTVTINLTNALAENVSILIPGQTVASTGGVSGLFAAEAAANGGTVSYSFTALEGTYLYESGSNASIQIPMGLYGALIVDSGVSGQAYGNAFDQEAVLLLSEIDPCLNSNNVHESCEPNQFTSLLDYHPTYWLINGEGYPNTANISANPGDQVLLRYLNAGFDHPSMELLGAYQQVIAKDSYTLNNPFDVIAETIPAGSTADMLVDTTGLGEMSLALFNRNMYVTNADAYPGGMLTFIEIAAPVGTPPTIDIVSPAQGSTVFGDMVAVQINATDTEDAAGSLTVEWNLDGGAWQAAPWTGSSYEATWDTTSFGDGAHSLNARATDSDANTASDSNDVVVSNAPVVSVVAPAEAATIYGDMVLVQIDANDAEDAAGTLTVAFDVDGGASTPAIYNGGSGYYEATLDTTGLSDGAHTINAQATDSRGFNGSDNNNVTVDNTAPTVSITSPADGGTVSGLYTIEASASDATSGVSQVTFYDGLTLIGTDNDGGNGWSVSWDTNAAGDGSHALTATATDGVGLSTTSDVVNVTVDNSIQSTMHITELSGSVTNTSPGGPGGGTYSVDVIITAHDANHDPLSGVTVSGVWTTSAGGFTVVTNSCVTNVSGQCIVQAVHNLNPNNASNNLTFTVNGLTLTSYTYVPADNEVPSSVTVQRP